MCLHIDKLNFSKTHKLSEEELRFSDTVLKVFFCGMENADWIVIKRTNKKEQEFIQSYCLMFCKM